ncbi:hypothetical protein D3C81_1560580 [compost metagenome]
MRVHNAILQFGPAIIWRVGNTSSWGPCNYSVYRLRGCPFAERISVDLRASPTVSYLRDGCNLAFSRPLCVCILPAIPAIASPGVLGRIGKRSIGNLSNSGISCCRISIPVFGSRPSMVFQYYVRFPWSSSI